MALLHRSATGGYLPPYPNKTRNLLYLTSTCVKTKKSVGSLSLSHVKYINHAYNICLWYCVYLCLLYSKGWLLDRSKWTILEYSSFSVEFMHVHACAHAHTIISLNPCETKKNVQSLSLAHTCAFLCTHTHTLKLLYNQHQI